MPRLGWRAGSRGIRATGVGVVSESRCRWRCWRTQLWVCCDACVSRTQEPGREGSEHNTVDTRPSPTTHPTSHVTSCHEQSPFPAALRPPRAARPSTPLPIPACISIWTTRSALPPAACPPADGLRCRPALQLRPQSHPVAATPPELLGRMPRHLIAMFHPLPHAPLKLLSSPDPVALTSNPQDHRARSPPLYSTVLPCHHAEAAGYPLYRVQCSPPFPPPPLSSYPSLLPSPSPPLPIPRRSRHVTRHATPTWAGPPGAPRWCGTPATSCRASPRTARAPRHLQRSTPGSQSDGAAV